MLEKEAARNAATVRLPGPLGLSAIGFHEVQDGDILHLSNSGVGRTPVNLELERVHREIAEPGIAGHSSCGIEWPSPDNHGGWDGRRMADGDRAKQAGQGDVSLFMPGEKCLGNLRSRDRLPLGFHDIHVRLRWQVSWASGLSAPLARSTHE